MRGMSHQNRPVFDEIADGQLESASLKDYMMQCNLLCIKALRQDNATKVFGTLSSENIH